VSLHTWVLRITTHSILRHAPYDSCKEDSLSRELSNYTVHRDQVFKKLIVNYTWSTSLFSKIGKVFFSTPISLHIIRIGVHMIILWSITVSLQTVHVEFQLLPLMQFMLNNVAAFTLSVLDSTKKSMTNIILSLIILYKLPMYCLYIILYAGIIDLIIFLKPGLEPRLWAFSCCKPSPSPIQARRWAGLGRAQTGRAWVGFGPGPAHH
jgi:hypothetical protein